MSTRSTRCKAQGRLTRQIISAMTTLSTLAVIFLIATVFPERLAGYVNEGISLAVERVLPTTFPFMVLSSFAEAALRPEEIPLVARMISLVFGISPSAASALFVGNTCGFPVGGKMICSLYEAGAIDKGSAERALAYADNPSPAFVIGVVGVGLFGNVKVGIVLLLSIYISTAVSAQFFRVKRGVISNTGFVFRQKYNFVDSIRTSAISSLTLSGFIVIFSVMAGAVKSTALPTVIEVPILAIMEVTSGVNFFSLAFSSTPILAVLFSGFSLGFGGLSVMAQIASFTKDAALSLRYYVAIKLVSAIFAAALSALLFHLFI